MKKLASVVTCLALVSLLAGCCCGTSKPKHKKSKASSHKVDGHHDAKKKVSKSEFGKVCAECKHLLKECTCL